MPSLISANGGRLSEVRLVKTNTAPAAEDLEIDNRRLSVILICDKTTWSLIPTTLPFEVLYNGNWTTSGLALEKR